MPPPVGTNGSGSEQVVTVEHALQVFARDPAKMLSYYLLEHRIFDLLSSLNDRFRDDHGVLQKAIPLLAQHIYAAETYLRADKTVEFKAMRRYIVAQQAWDSFLETDLGLDAAARADFAGRLDMAAGAQSPFVLVHQLAVALQKYQEQRAVIADAGISEFLSHSLVYNLEKIATLQAQGAGREAIPTMQQACVIDNKRYTWQKITCVADPAAAATDAKVLDLYLFHETAPELSSKLYFVWVGTNNSEKMAADGERNPGAETYWRHEPTILLNTFQALGRLATQFAQTRFSVSFSGHSLGGTLSQMHFRSFAFAYAKQLAAAKQDAQLTMQLTAINQAYMQELKSLDADADGKGTNFATHQKEYDIERAFNPEVIEGLHLKLTRTPGALLPVARQANILANLLIEKGLSVMGLYERVNGDPVNDCGQARLFVDSKCQAPVALVEVGEPDPEFAQACSPLGLISQLRGWALGFIDNALAAHQKKHFTSGLCPEQPVITYDSSRIDLARFPRNLELYRTGEASANQMLPYYLDRHSTSLDGASSVISSVLHSGTRTQLDNQHRVQAFKDRFSRAVMGNDREGIWTIVRETLEKEHEQLLDWLLAEKPELLTSNCPKGKTILHHAVELGQWEKAVKILDVVDMRVAVGKLALPMKAGLMDAQIQASGQQPGDTALHQFMAWSNPGHAGYQFAIKMLEAGARIDITGSKQKTVAEQHQACKASWGSYAPAFRGNYAKYFKLMDERATLVNSAVVNQTGVAVGASHVDAAATTTSGNTPPPPAGTQYRPA